MSWPDFIYKLLTSAKGVLAALVIAAAVIAGGTFMLAAPGSEVTVLWGLARFTKDKPAPAAQPAPQTSESKEGYKLPSTYPLHGTTPSTLLDNSISIVYDGDRLFIGGANISLLKLAARSGNGQSLWIRRREKSSDLEVELADTTYVEIEYKGNFYSITTQKYDYKRPEAIVDNIAKPTLRLTEYAKVI